MVPTGNSPIQATLNADFIQYTEKKEAPPGFEFVPIGNPALTTACKEISREQDAMVFIVTVCKRPDSPQGPTLMLV